jgi:hypothetical protein
MISSNPCSTLTRYRWHKKPPRPRVVATGEVDIVHPIPALEQKRNRATFTLMRTREHGFFSFAPKDLASWSFLGFFHGQYPLPIVVPRGCCWYYGVGWGWDWKWWREGGGAAEGIVGETSILKRKSTPTLSACNIDGGALAGLVRLLNPKWAIDDVAVRPKCARGESAAILLPWARGSRGRTRVWFVLKWVATNRLACLHWVIGLGFLCPPIGAQTKTNRSYKHTSLVGVIQKKV